MWRDNSGMRFVFGVDLGCSSNLEAIYGMFVNVYGCFFLFIFMFTTTFYVVGKIIAIIIYRLNEKLNIT